VREAFWVAHRGGREQKEGFFGPKESRFLSGRSEQTPEQKEKGGGKNEDGLYGRQ